MGFLRDKAHANGRTAITTKAISSRVSNLDKGCSVARRVAGFTQASGRMAR
jgi:hypothetical protein